MSGNAEAWRPVASFATLRRRSELVERVRGFFRDRGVLEVDTPVLQPGANLDRGVAPYRVETPEGPRFLPTSPEHPLKRLIAAGSGAVWTLAPACRRGERGRRHLPEFRMLEWYRPAWDETQIAEETVALLRSLSALPGDIERLPFADACREHAGIDPFTADLPALQAVLGSAAAAPRDRDEALDLVWSLRVQPHLGHGRWTLVTDWPPWAAAQARTRMVNGRLVAARFELFREGLELANGYYELTDSRELQRRLAAERATRDTAETLEFDTQFAAAMAHGLGDCAGVAVGFDRVVMLALNLDELRATVAFPDG